MRSDISDMKTLNPFTDRVEKGVETSVYITEFAVIRILVTSAVTSSLLVTEQSRVDRVLVIGIVRNRPPRPVELQYSYL